MFYYNPARQTLSRRPDDCRRPASGEYCFADHAGPWLYAVTAAVVLALVLGMLELSRGPAESAAANVRSAPVYAAVLVRIGERGNI
jgi:hypothetical protein